MDADPTFRIETETVPDDCQAVLVGLPHLGMASVTAADYLISQTDASNIGRVHAVGLPSIAPFENGTPRHHTRLYHIPETEVLVLIGDLFIPVWAADAFSHALADWGTAHELAEAAVLHGVPYPHSETEHEVYSVASERYRSERLSGSDIDPLGGGFLDGVPGALVTADIEREGLPTGVYVTPVHPPGPDIDAAIRLVTTMKDVYGLAVELSELEQQGAEFNAHYVELADRMQTLKDERLPTRDHPEDRMYM